jgi:hypothetical protein
MESSTPAPQTEQTLWNGTQIQKMLNEEVRYKDWRFVVQSRDVMGHLGPQDVDIRLRAEWTGADAATGKPELQQSRWWPLNPHMVKTEIIQTAFLCVLKAEEHEIRETFKYFRQDHAADFGGFWAAPFNSHIHIDTLAWASEEVDVRTDPRPNAPKNQRRE